MMKEQILPKIIMKGHIIVPSTDLIAVQNELPTHIHKTRQEAGCLIFDVAQDEENINRFNVHEEFVDEESFSVHQNRVKNSEWGAISKNVERHYQISKCE